MSRLPRRPAWALASALVGSLALAGCGSDSGSGSGSTGTGGGGDKTYQIGISQIITHPSLDEAREGFKKALADGGIKAEFEEQNAQGEQATLTSIANKFRGKDLVLAIATPTAQATAQAITDKPVLFTAVTDPVEAKLVKSNDAPGANVTGTTDMNPVDRQLALVKDIKPDAKTVGIIYSSAEVNSAVQVRMAEEAAPGLGLTIQKKAITNTGEVAQAAQSLDVDAIYVPTDNTVVSAIESVLSAAQSKHLPVVVAEGDSVRKGGMATYGINYFDLGQQTGRMAIKILKDGAAPATMPVEKQTDFKLLVNQMSAAKAGVTLPQALLDRADEVIK